MSKKVKKASKIDFESINKGEYSIVNPKDLQESNERISKEMKKTIREFKNKEAISIQEASKLIINT